jgi:hypothetical protein
MSRILAAKPRLPASALVWAASASLLPLSVAYSTVSFCFGTGAATGAATLPSTASSPARNPASQARCTAEVSPMTRSRAAICSGANGAVRGREIFGILGAFSIRRAVKGGQFKAGSERRAV